MPLRTSSVECHVHPRIASEPVEVGAPFLDDVFSADAVPVVVEHVPDSSDGVLSSISANHGRSYQIVLPDQAEADGVLLRDRFGNPYTALNTKGNNFSLAEIIETSTAPSGYIPYGLHEGDALLRVLRASRILRKVGVDTEWIVRIFEPKQLLYKHGGMEVFVPPSEYRRLIVSELQGKLALSQTANLTEVDEAEDALTEDEVNKIESVLGKMDFFITVRAMATPYRINDIVRPPTAPAGRWLGLERIDLTTLEKVFSDYNRVAPQRQRDFTILGLPDSLTFPESDGIRSQGSDIGRYFSEILPKLLALNMAKMHNAGLVHVFPHIGNITGLGGIVDLDSVKGRPLKLGDKIDLKNSIIHDIDYPFSEDNLDRLTNIMRAVGRYFGRTTWSPLEAFQENFLLAYLQIRGLDPAQKSKQKKAIELMSGIDVESGLIDSVFQITRNAADPHIGSYVTDTINEKLKDKVELAADEVAHWLYGYYLKHHVTNPELITPNADGSLPPFDEVRSTLRGYLNSDGKDIVGKFEIDESIYKYVQAIRYTNLQEPREYLDNTRKEVKEMLRGTPISRFGDHEIDMIVASYLRPAVMIAANNYELPGPEEVWDIITQLFHERYLEATTAPVAA